MICTVSYILIAILFVIALFFLIRSIVVMITLFTEVPYLPSNELFKQAIEYLDISDGDNILDMGSGDGRVLLYASGKYPKASFVGIEKNLFLVLYSKIAAFVCRRKNLKYKKEDFLKCDISNFDGIYMYLLPRLVDDILKMDREKFKDGCRVVSFRFPLKKIGFVNKISKYSVKYGSKTENIFKWVNI